MSIENEPKIEIKKYKSGITHTTVTAPDGKIVFDRMIKKGKDTRNHIFEIDYHNLLPKNLEKKEVIPIEIKEYPCGITHTIKRYPNGKIFFDRMENTNKALPKLYRTF